MLLFSVTELIAHDALPVLFRLDECCEFVEGHPPAGFVVGCRDARRQVVVDGEHICSAARIRKRERDHHLAAHCGIGRLEFHHFDHLRIGYELDELAMVRIGARGRLASPGRLVVRERDSEQPTFASMARASKECPWLVMAIGTIHVATACGSNST
jgi:hypothetical protein